MKKPVATILLASILLVQSTVSSAASAADEGTPQQVAYGAGSFLGTLVYTPFKATFCILGSIASAFTLVFAGQQNAGKVAGASCRGTWVITPDVLKGQEQVKFVGDVSASDSLARQ